MRKRREENVDVPITPMLDMAFQLLTFFVLTYRPMPAEGQFVMNLMPAAPATDINAEAPENAPINPDLPASLRTLPTTLRAGEGGTLGKITLGDNDFQGDMAKLRGELAQIFKDPTLPFDQTLIKVDPDLKYAELMQVINAFSLAFADAKKEAKLSFAELSPEERGPP